jgi:hypothetical protein
MTLLVVTQLGVIQSQWIVVGRCDIRDKKFGVDQLCYT